MPPHASRRALLASLGGGAAALAGCSSLPPLDAAPAPVDCEPLPSVWPTAGANPGRTGVAPDARLPSADAEPRRLMDRDDPGAGGVEAPPAVADGTAFVTSRVATASAHGAHDWTFEEGAGSWLVPAVDCGIVYVHANVGAVALDPATGDVHWRTESDAASPGMSVANPAVVGDTLYLGTEVVVALDGRTGKRRWVREFPEDTASQGLAATDDAVVVAAEFAHDGYGYLACFDSDGTRRWLLRPHPVDHTFAGPVVADDSVYVATDEGLLFAVDLDSGAVRWRAPVDRDIDTGLAVRDGTVFVPGAASGTFRAFDAADGSARWTRKLGYGVSAPAVVDGRLLVAAAGHSGETDVDGAGFAAVDPATGDVERRYDSRSVGAFAVGDGVVYYRYGGDSSLWALR